MSNDTIDELGPVDYVVVEFPPGASHFTGEMAAELAALVKAGTVRVLDVLILAKDADGSVEALEIDDLDTLDELRVLETEIAEILAADDVEHLGAAMEPGSVAGVVVWENRWAAPFASAARRSGGQLIASGRVPIQAIIASLEADPTLQAEGA
jgi:fructosamine-3-kinase